MKQDQKTLQLLKTLQKTEPPVVIFCENKNDVDDINKKLNKILKLLGDKSKPAPKKARTTAKRKSAKKTAKKRAKKTARKTVRKTARKAA